MLQLTARKGECARLPNHSHRDSRSNLAVPPPVVFELIIRDSRRALASSRSLSTPYIALYPRSDTTRIE
jgi:hypothetical protein